jgi:hypothetical protein
MKRSTCSSRCTVLIVILVLVSCTSEKETYTLSQLQGAWWSDPESPTADFAIHGAEIWFDYDSKYHPCRIAGGDTLVYDLGPELGIIRQRIVSLEEDTLILEITFYGETTRTTYRRPQ